jgi:3-oxoacyl-[acyl-carrier-protein] synthase III
LKKVGLKSLAYALGNLREISDIVDIHLTKLGDPNFRRLHGVHYYLETDKTVFDLALESARKTIENSQIDKQRISAIFFSTVSHYAEDLAVEKDFGGRLMHELGLYNCYFYGVFAQNCATVAGAIRLANAYLNNLHDEDILIISADKISQERGIGRLGPFYARSDAAVSCILTKENYEYELSLFSEFYDPDLWNVTHDNDRPKLLKSFKLNTKRVINKCLEINAVSRDQISYVLCNNHDTLIWRHMADFWEIPYERFYTRNIPRISHCPAGDVFINLIDLEVEESIPFGSNLLTFFSGPHAWTVTILKKLDGD